MVSALPGRKACLVKWQQEYRKKVLQIIGITCTPTESADVCRFLRSIKVNYQKI